MKKIAILIKKSALEFDKIANKALQPYGISHTQFLILKFLYLNKNKKTRQIDLERHLSMSNPTITGILKNMEKSGLIARMENPEDKRSRSILLTEKSSQLEGDLMQLGDRLDAELTKNLSEKEKAQVLMLLSKMLGGTE